MNETSAECIRPELDWTVFQLARATRFALALLVLGLSYVAIRASLSIPSFKLITGDMLGSETQLPALTQFIFKTGPVLVGLSFAIPAACIGLLFVRNPIRSIYAIGVLGLLVILEGIILYHGIFGLFAVISTRMQGGPGPL